MRTWMGLFCLALGAWLAATVGWAAVAERTYLPGPAETAERSARLVATAITAPPWPGALARPPQAVARGVRRSGEAAGRLFRGPERIAARLFGCDAATPAPSAWSAPNVPRATVRPRAPTAPSAPTVGGAAAAGTRIRADLRIGDEEIRERVRQIIRHQLRGGLESLLAGLDGVHVRVVVN